jgi:hypothetical protein
MLLSSPNVRTGKIALRFPFFTLNVQKISNLAPQHAPLTEPAKATAALE